MSPTVRRGASAILALAFGGVFASVVLAATTQVSIQNFTFTPGSIAVRMGDQVTWTNLDGVSHSVKWISAGAPADGPILSQGQTYSTVFNALGRFDYICGVHGSSMSGTVTVIPQATTASPTTPPTTTAPPTTPPPTTAPPVVTTAPPPTTAPPVVTTAPPPVTTSAAPSAATSAPPSASTAASATASLSSPPATSARPSQSPVAAPAAEANTLLGTALIVVGVVVLGGALWWRFGRGARA